MSGLGKALIWRGKSGKMKSRRFANPAVIGTKIYLAGGYADYSTIEELTPETERFRPIPCSVPIRHCGSALSVNNTLVVLSSEGITRCSEDFAVILQTPLLGFSSALQFFSVVNPLWSGDACYLLVTAGLEYVRLSVRAKTAWEPEVREVI